MSSSHAEMLRSGPTWEICRDFQTDLQQLSHVEIKKTTTKSMTRSLFIESLIGNIKEKYFFEKKLGGVEYAWGQKSDEKVQS